MIPNFVVTLPWTNLLVLVRMCIVLLLLLTIAFNILDETEENLRVDCTFVMLYHSPKSVDRINLSDRSSNEYVTFN